MPDEVQKITIFSAGIVIGSQEPEAAKALITFLASPAATRAISASGLQAITRPENSQAKRMTNSK